MECYFCHKISCTKLKLKTVLAEIKIVNALCVFLNKKSKIKKKMRIERLKKMKSKFKSSAQTLGCPIFPYLINRSQFPSAIGWRKKSNSYNHKTTIWVSHEYYWNLEFHKILWRVFWVIAILVFSPYGARVDFKALIS